MIKNVSSVALNRICTSITSYMVMVAGVYLRNRVVGVICVAGIMIWAVRESISTFLLTSCSRNTAKRNGSR